MKLIFVFVLFFGVVLAVKFIFGIDVDVCFGPGDNDLLLLLPWPWKVKLILGLFIWFGSGLLYLNLIVFYIPLW